MHDVANIRYGFHVHIDMQVRTYRPRQSSRTSVTMALGFMMVNEDQSDVQESQSWIGLLKEPFANLQHEPPF